jgi:hypothetical protein
LRDYEARLSFFDLTGKTEQLDQYQDRIEAYFSYIGLDIAELEADEDEVDL